MAPCRLCGSNEIEIFFQEAQYPISGGPVIPPGQAARLKYAKLQVGVCVTCGYIMLVAPMPEALADSLYQGFYSSSNPVVEDPEEITDSRVLQLLDFMESILQSKSGKVLEIAAYDGQFLYQLRKRGWEVYGCEPNPIGQQAAQRYGMEIKQAYFGPGLYPPSSFDLIVGRFVLEHVPDPVAFTQDVWTFLRPGGYLVLDVPDGEARVLNRILGSLVPEHVSYFGPHTLRSTLARAGFTEIELLSYPGGLAAKARREEKGPTKVSVTNRSDLPQLLAGVRGYSRDVAEKLAALRAMVSRFHKDRKRIVIYGANTQTIDYLSNGAISADQVEYVIDDDPHKQGCYLVGTNLQVYTPSGMAASRPEVVVISAYFSQDKMAAAIQDRLGPNVTVVRLYPELETVGAA